MQKKGFIRDLVCWLKYRKARKEQARRAASLAVKLVMNGCLSPPKFTGIGPGPSPRNCVLAPDCKILVRREGWA